MPYLYIPLPEDHELAPAYEKRYYPTGRPVADICAEQPGWEPSMPANADVYKDGRLIQRAPQKAARKAKGDGSHGA